MRYLSIICLFAISASACASKIEVDGTYSYSTDAMSLDFIGEQVCFYVSEGSAAMIPRGPDDERVPWFCFNDSEAAAELLGFTMKPPEEGCGYQGEARIVISNYNVVLNETSDNDLANLERVLSSTQPIVMSCDDI